MAKTNIVFSASSFNLWEWCECKYNYAHIMRKTLPVDQKPEPLDRGGLGHIGMEVYFNQLATGVHYNDRMHNAIMKIKAAASDATFSNIDMTEELPILTSNFTQSCEHWRFEDEHLEILAVETPFDYVIFEDEWIRIIISGKIDLMVNKKGHGGEASYTNLPYDHKFVTRDFPVDRTDNQFINYAHAVSSNYIIVNKVGMQKTLKPEEKYKRIPLSYDPLFIDQWKENVIRVVIDKYLPARLRNHYPMRFSNCRKFGRLCEFHPVCNSSGEDAKKWKLESQYIDREPWDKYAEEGEEGAI